MGLRASRGDPDLLSLLSYTQPLASGPAHQPGCRGNAARHPPDKEHHHGSKPRGTRVRGVPREREREVVDTRPRPGRRPRHRRLEPQGVDRAGRRHVRRGGRGRRPRPVGHPRGRRPRQGAAPLPLRRIRHRLHALGPQGRRPHRQGRRSPLPRRGLPPGARTPLPRAARRRRDRLPLAALAGLRAAEHRQHGALDRRHPRGDAPAAPAREGGGDPGRDRQRLTVDRPHHPERVGGRERRQRQDAQQEHPRALPRSLAAGPRRGLHRPRRSAS